MDADTPTPVEAPTEAATTRKSSVEVAVIATLPPARRWLPAPTPARTFWVTTWTTMPAPMPALPSVPPRPPAPLRTSTLWLAPMVIVWPAPTATVWLTSVLAPRVA